MSNYIYSFKITLKQQLILLGHSVFIWVGLIVVIVYVFKRSLLNETSLFVFPFIFLIDTLPTFILHTQYWIKNHGAILTVNTETKELMYETKSEVLRYSFDNIISLQYYRNLGKGSGWNSFGEYRYYKIIFNDNKEAFITCLMINDIENTLEMLLKMQAEKHSKLLCLLG